MLSNYQFKQSPETQESIYLFFNLGNPDPGFTSLPVVDYKTCRDMLDPLRVLYLCPHRFRD